MIEKYYCYFVTLLGVMELYSVAFICWDNSVEEMISLDQLYNNKKIIPIAECHMYLKLEKKPHSNVE